MKNITNIRPCLMCKTSFQENEFEEDNDLCLACYDMAMKYDLFFVSRLNGKTTYHIGDEDDFDNSIKPIA